MIKILKANFLSVGHQMLKWSLYLQNYTIVRPIFNQSLQVIIITTMHDSFDSQYSTAASLSYRTTDSRRTTNVRRQIEDLLLYSSDRVARNILQALKQQIQQQEKQYEHDHLSSSRREQRPQVRSRRDQQVVPLNERDENTQLEVNNAPMHMIGQPAFRQGQSQNLERSINRQAQSSARVSQPRQEPRLSLNRPERSSQSIQVNSVDFQFFQRQGEAELKRVPIKGRFFNRCPEPFNPPHTIYDQRQQEYPQKEEAPVPLRRQNSAQGQHFWENRRNTLTSEEIMRHHSKNSHTLKKQHLVIERH